MKSVPAELAAIHVGDTVVGRKTGWRSRVHYGEDRFQTRGVLGADRRTLVIRGA